jgi:membrane-bound lytic murein transglycosylase D
MKKFYSSLGPSVLFLIFIACAGSGRMQQPPAVTVMPPEAVVQEEEEALSLDQITLADSLLVQQSPERIIREAHKRYDTAVTALAAADTASARTAIDEVLSLMIVLNGVQAPAITDERKVLLRQINQFISSIQDGHQASIEVKGVMPRILNNSIRKQIKAYSGSNKGVLLRSYARSGLYGDMIRNELALKGMPQELQWLPVVESAFMPRAYSWADAVGMWQFIYETGKRYGLTRTGFVDDRMDPFKATPAALGYLSDLYDMFDDWQLALAAYNCGEGRVLRAINRSGTRDYWKLRLPRETRGYVPKLLAVIHILDNPEQYGVTLSDLHPAYVFEEIQVDKSITLKDAAEVLDVPLDDLKALNTGLRYSVTPATGYLLRVPLGVGATLMAVADEIPTSNFTPPPEIRKYRVRRGDTLGHIADRFKTSVRKLRSMNNIRGSLIRIGQTIRVPGKTYNADAWNMASTASSPVKSAGPADLTTASHTVRRGDTLYDVARRYGTAISILKRTNGMSGNAIRVGQKLRLPDRVGETSQTGSAPVAHTPYKIRRGDTLSEIAERFRISLTTLKRTNPSVRANRIKVGQVIYIPGTGGSPDAVKRPDVHIVRRGDSIWNIARRYGLTVTQVLNLNGLKNGSVIKPGQVLKLT